MRPISLDRLLMSFLVVLQVANFDTPLHRVPRSDLKMVMDVVACTDPPLTAPVVNFLIDHVCLCSLRQHTWAKLRDQRSWYSTACSGEPCKAVGKVSS